MVSEPIVKNLINGYRFLWVEGDEWTLYISLTKLLERSRGEITAELNVAHTFKEKPTISNIRFNMASQQARNTIAKRLTEAKIIPGMNWPELVDQICSEAIRRHREGQPYEELWTSEDIPEIEYLLEPILLKGIPTVIFGEKGVTKSTIALLIYICLILPWYDNPLGLKPQERSIKTLILDWETPSNIVQWNAKRLQEGLELPPFPVYHRKCNSPLSDDVESIAQMVVDIGAEAIIIDSLARAAGGELSKDTENANRFFYSLDKLNCTSLIIAQTSKDSDTKKKTIYGSAMYTYYARSIFELCKNQEIGEDELSVALFHRWSNLTRLQKPMGFRFKYNGNHTFVESESVDYGQFKERITTGSQILDILKRGSLSVVELMEEMDITRSNANKTLQRLLSKGKVVKLPNSKWGLASEYG